MRLVARFRLLVAAALVVGLGSAAEASEGLGGPKSVAALAARLSPAVVNISSSHHLPGGQGVPYPKAPDGTALNPNVGADGKDPGDTGDEAESLGSGFIISADVVIVTNNHVIDGADDIEIYLTDGSHLPAKVLGADSKTDLAVLKIEATHPLPFVEFGDSDTAEVGDWVMAIGNPFGLGGTVTLGIVSARNRDIQSGPYDSYLQTDASINQGNSGGPLFDMDGKVVGINTAIIAEGGSSLGIGFAIPSSLAKTVVDQLAQYGEARRGWLGVGIQDVTDDIAASLGRSDTHGAMVTDVTQSGPSDGVLKEGDIILDFDGKSVDTMHDLPRLVAETPVGKTVPLRVLRKGSEQVLSITVGRLHDTDEAQAKVSKGTPAAPAPAPQPNTLTLSDRLGFEMAPLDPAHRRTYGLADEVTGLVVVSVKSGTDAEDKGMQPGFVVTEANQQPVASLAEVQSIVDAARRAGRAAVLFKVVDPNGQGRFIGVKLAG